MDGPVHRPQRRLPTPESRALWRRWWRSVGMGLVSAVAAVGLHAASVAAYRNTPLQFALLTVAFGLLHPATVILPLWAWRSPVRSGWVRWCAPPMIGALLVVCSFLLAIPILTAIKTANDLPGAADAHYRGLAREIVAYFAKGDRHAKPPAELRWFIPTGASRGKPSDSSTARHLSGNLVLTTSQFGTWRLQYRSSETPAEICVFSDRCIAGRCGRSGDPTIESPC